MRPLVTALVVAALLVVARPHDADKRVATLAGAQRKALATLTGVYYDGVGGWRACDAPGCPVGDSDWGDDSLTYTLFLAATDAHDQRAVQSLSALAANAPQYPASCDQPATCMWSDTAEWDAVALADEYQATGDPNALAKAQAAFSYVNRSTVFAGGACPSIPYQKPAGGLNHLKTLETEANAIKAAILLYRDTNDPAYLSSALAGYQAARSYFLDSVVPLYTVYVFDRGQGCRQLRHRFFASVNGDMIWSGVALAQITGQPTYLAQAVATAEAVQRDLSDARGVYADLQAENDIVEPLVEGMDALARRDQQVGLQWLLTNAAAAVSARTHDGSFGRFFDGPPPPSTVTAWQTNGGLSLEIAAASLAPETAVQSPMPWVGARRVPHQLRELPGAIRFAGAGIAVFGTLGERCCESGHATVLVDGRQTFDWSGIWQNKTSLHQSIANTILFAWRWPHAGRHTLMFLPGSTDAKEGSSFLHLTGYQVLRP
ncbi:MAG: hypothetical protein JO206_02560 [Solirubrobacterales bacterium]|nr:hypothetical protein [Solirubrobacterales bacterium]